MNKFELPTIFVIFGITGDLFRTKMLKSLYALHAKDMLPKKFQIYGFSRREMNNESIKEYVLDIMKDENFSDPEKYESFLKYFYYVSGNFDTKESYKNLAGVLGRVDDHWKICSNKLFYLAVPPQYYRDIIDNIHDSGLTIPCSPEEGWTRVILEKPFGTNLKTAKELDARLAELFKEEQIYRVDHYLAKETVRNILAFRFSNSFFTSWDSKSIEKMEIKVLESKTVSRRGDFYDKVGSLRDVGQNHMLQLLALFTMDNPGSLTPENIRAERTEALKQLRIFSNEEIPIYTKRAQYEGYKNEKGVASDSKTETYFKIKAFSNAFNFTNVPLYLESGKGLKDLTEVTITFKHRSPCLCPPHKHSQNILRYLISPQEKILASFLVKQPGYEYTVEEQDFEFDYRKAYKNTTFIHDYEQLLMDIIKGDQTLFVTTEEIFREWEFVEPILNAWSNQELLTYKEKELFSPKVADDTRAMFRKEIGLIGLGKMGTGIALNLLEKGWQVSAYNRSPEKVDLLLRDGIVPMKSVEQLVTSLPSPKVVWIMVTAGQPVDDALFGTEGLMNYLEKGDIIIDGGNTFYKDSIRRGEKLAEKGIRFVDVGFSGGPSGARNGGCLMIGGDKNTFKELHSLYHDISLPGGYQHFDGVGAGHFIKMVHNGIEYGMMQSIGEGMEVMKKSAYNPDLEKVADIYNHGSVIESRLVEWLYNAYKIYGQDLEGISSVVGHTGEGAWTVDTANELGVAVPVIKESLQFRIDSAKNPSYTGKVLSALRNMFGGHKVK